MTDKELVRKILRGDRQAYRKLVQSTERLVAQMVSRMIPNPEDRRDIAQDVYLKVYRNLADFKFKCKLSTWIGQITYNTCLHYLEKKRPYLLEDSGNEDDEQDQFELLVQKMPGNSEEIEARIHAGELKVILNSGIGQLPPVLQTLIGLYHQEELSIKEISEVTCLPAGTVKSYLLRARRQLKSYLLANYKREEL